MKKDVGGADQRLTSQVHEIVGRINGRYGSVTFVPIHHLVSSCAFSLFSLLRSLKGSVFADYLCGGITLCALEWRYFNPLYLLRAIYELLRWQQSLYTLPFLGFFNKFL